MSSDLVGTAKNFSRNETQPVFPRIWAAERAFPSNQEQSQSRSHGNIRLTVTNLSI